MVMSNANRNRMLAEMKARRNAQNARETARLLAGLPPTPTHRARVYTYANMPSVPTHKAKGARGSTRTTTESMNAKMKRWQRVLQQRREAQRREMERRLKAYAALARRVRKS